jgi:hypothetical protein
MVNTWARIENNTVAEVTHIDPQGRFHASLIWVPCPDNTESGMQWADGMFFERPAAPINHQAKIAAKRFKHETAGILFNELKVETSRDSQAAITAAALSAVINPTYVCTWKTETGPIELTATQLISLANQVRTHVQTCFDREFQLLAQLATDTYEPDMLDHGWPTAPGT